MQKTKRASQTDSNLPAPAIKAAPTILIFLMKSIPSTRVLLHQKSAIDVDLENFFWRWVEKVVTAIGLPNLYWDLSPAARICFLIYTARGTIIYTV